MFENGNYMFVIEKGLAGQATYFKIDISYMGFNIESDVPLIGGSCSTSCGSGGCGSA